MRRRRSSCCMRAWARRRCGAISPIGSPGAPRPACSSIRVPATGAPRRSRCRARSTTCSARRRRSCRARRALGRRLDRRRLCRQHPGPSRARAGAPRAALLRRGLLATRDRARQGALRRRRPARQARPPPCRCRRRLPRLERRLARSRLRRCFRHRRAARLHPRAGPDRAGRGRPLRDRAADRGRRGGVLLPGRRRVAPRLRPCSAPRQAGRDPGGGRRLHRAHPGAARRSQDGARRLTRGLPLPARAHVPGSGSAPDRAPLEAAKRLVRKPAVAAWQGDAAYRYGARLYVEGFFWEAHEVWEAVWKVSSQNGVERLLLRGLIQLANAALKLTMGRGNAALRLLIEADALLGDTAAAAGSEVAMGVGLAPLRTAVQELAASLGAGAEADVTRILEALAAVAGGWTSAETAL